MVFMSLLALKKECATAPFRGSTQESKSPAEKGSLKARCQKCFQEALLWLKSLVWAACQYFYGREKEVEESEDLSKRPSIVDILNNESPKQIALLESSILEWDGGNGNTALAHHFGVKARLALRDALNFDSFVALLKNQLLALAKEGILSQTDRETIRDLFAAPEFRKPLEQYFGPPRKAPPATPVNPVTGFPLPASLVVDSRLQRLLG